MNPNKHTKMKDFHKIRSTNYPKGSFNKFESYYNKHFTNYNT